MSFNLILYIAVPAGVAVIILISVIIAICIHGAPSWCPCSRRKAGTDVEKGLGKKKTAAKKPAAKKPSDKKPAAKKPVATKKSDPAKPAKNPKEDNAAKKDKEDKAAKKTKEEKAAKKAKEEKAAKKAKEEKAAKKAKEEKAKKEKEAKKGKDDKKDKNGKEKDDKSKKPSGKVSPAKDTPKPTAKKVGAAKTKVLAVVAFGGRTTVPAVKSSNAAKNGMKTSGMGMANVA